MIVVQVGTEERSRTQPVGVRGARKSESLDAPEGGGSGMPDGTGGVLVVFLTHQTASRST